MNLAYRVQKLFRGERGTILKVEPIEDDRHHVKDHFGQLPKVLTILDPLGNTVKVITPLKWKYYHHRADLTEIELKVYGDYEVGQKYP